MTAAIRFDLAAAEAAEDREENGADLLPGDRALIDALDGWRQQEWDRYWAKWLTGQCGGCHFGGTGAPCDYHIEDDEVSS
jgi:hypothetical protein